MFIINKTNSVSFLKCWAKWSNDGWQEVFPCEEQKPDSMEESQIFRERNNEDRRGQRVLYWSVSNIWEDRNTRTQGGEDQKSEESHTEDIQSVQAC